MEEAQTAFADAAAVLAFIAVPDVDDEPEDGDSIDFQPVVRRFFDAVPRCLSTETSAALAEAHLGLWALARDYDEMGGAGSERLQWEMQGRVPITRQGAAKRTRTAADGGGEQDRVLPDGSTVIRSSLGYHDSPYDAKQMEARVLGSSGLALHRLTGGPGSELSDEELRAQLRARMEEAIPPRHIPAVAPERPSARSTPFSRFDAFAPTQPDLKGTLLGRAAAAVAAAHTCSDAAEAILPQLAGSPAGDALAAHLENPPLLHAVRQASCGVTSTAVSAFSFSTEDMASSLVADQGKLVLGGLTTAGYRGRDGTFPFARQWQQPLPATDTLLGKAAAALATGGHCLAEELPGGSPAQAALSSHIRKPGQGYFVNADMRDAAESDQPSSSSSSSARSRRMEKKQEDQGQGPLGIKTDFDVGFDSHIGAIAIDPEPGGLTWLASDGCGRIKGMASNGACKHTLQAHTRPGEQSSSPDAIAFVGTGAQRRIIAVGRKNVVCGLGLVHYWNMADLDHATGGWRAVPAAAGEEDVGADGGAGAGAGADAGVGAAAAAVPISRQSIDAEAEVFSRNAMEDMWELRYREDTSNLEATRGQEPHGCWEWDWGHRISLNTLAVVDGPAGLIALGFEGQGGEAGNAAAAVISLFDAYAGVVVARLFGHSPGRITSMELAVSPALPGLLVSSSNDQIIKCWDIGTTRPTTGTSTASSSTAAAAAAAAAVAGGPESTAVAVAKPNLNCRPKFSLWGGDVCEKHLDTVRAVALAEICGVPVVFSGSADDAVKCWDLQMGCCLYELSTGNASVAKMQWHAPSASLLVLAERHQSQASHAREHYERFGERFDDADVEEEEEEEEQQQQQQHSRWPAEAYHSEGDFEVLWDCVGGEQSSLGGKPVQTVVEYRFEPRPVHPKRVPKWAEKLNGSKPVVYPMLDTEQDAYR